MFYAIFDTPTQQQRGVHVLRTRRQARQHKQIQRAGEGGKQRDGGAEHGAGEAGHHADAWKKNFFWLKKIQYIKTVVFKIFLKIGKKFDESTRFKTFKIQHSYVIKKLKLKF